MAGEAIPEDLRRFLLAGTLSVPHVEAVLLLRSERTQPWDARRLASRLYVAEETALRLLADLAALKIATGDAAAGWGYAPATAELAALLDRLHHAYTHDLVAVTRLIHGAGDTAQRFAAAFRFRKEP